VFQKSYIGNILRIGRNKFQKSIFPGRVSKTKRELERGQRLPSPLGGAAQALAAPTCGEEPLVHS
jgi:hypothetical protein